MSEADLEAAGWERHPTDTYMYPWRDPVSMRWFSTYAALNELQRRAEGSPEFGPAGRIPPMAALPEVPASWFPEESEKKRRRPVPPRAT